MVNSNGWKQKTKTGRKVPIFSVSTNELILQFHKNIKVLTILRMCLMLFRWEDFQSYDKYVRFVNLITNKEWRTSTSVHFRLEISFTSSLSLIELLSPMPLSNIMTSHSRMLWMLDSPNERWGQYEGLSLTNTEHHISFALSQSCAVLGYSEKFRSVANSIPSSWCRKNSFV